MQMGSRRHTARGQHEPESRAPGETCRQQWAALGGEAHRSSVEHVNNRIGKRKNEYFEYLDVGLHRVWNAM